MNDKTLFERRTLAARPKSNLESKKTRKTRSDKKKNIKFKLSSQEKKQLQLRALDAKISLTEFCSRVVIDYLEKDIDYGDYEFDNNGVYVNVLLTAEPFQKIELLHIEWDLSKRKVVHRIIKEYLHREFDGVEVLDWRDN